MKNLLQKTKSFLEYLEENYEFPENRTWKKLEEKFGKRDFDNIRDFNVSRFIRNDIQGKGEDRIYRCQIDLGGLEFLERSKEEKRQKDRDKILLDATIVIAIATSLGIFITFWNLILASDPSPFKVWALLAVGIVGAFLFFVLIGKTLDIVSLLRKENNKFSLNRSG